MSVVGWQNDYPSRGGRLVSTDGINWNLTRDKMQIDLGNAGTFEDDMIYRQYIVNVNGTEYLYYNAKDKQSGWNERIGLAKWNNSIPLINPAKWSKTFGANYAGGGTFTIDAGRLKTMGVAPSGSSQVLQGNVKINTPNYSFSVDVTPISTSKDNSLHIRSTNLNNYYYAGIASWGGKYAIGKIVNGVNTKLVSTGLDSQISYNTTYKLKLVVSGTTIQLYDNGTLVLTASDNSLNPSSSYVDLQTTSSAGQAYFDNVSVDDTGIYDPTKYYKIINKLSGKALSISAGGTSNGSPAILYAFVNADDQLWQIVDVGGGYNKLINKKSGRALSIVSGGTTNGSQAHLWDFVNATDQKWSISAASTGYFKILNQNSLRALSCVNGAMANNTLLHLWDYLGNNPDQDWTIVPQ
ncbi:hypothetical protein EHS13_11375 [Paenibacillus psychroresistens]|uniref:Ricin B lectin domain-containing protein n=1 Tax=Paenibacillus psychroresistens TaxID=1778678 RepID=A0A6B8RGY4_9BACL|nr:RICIN domain-containing protein [Paenibacillus psychroresistens]QGQ95440.1 hypothetical protein EHS13_11375 [Paenibacillus psychroresistens]